MILIFKIDLKHLDDISEHDTEVLEDLNDAFNQGYNVKISLQATSQDPAILLLHKKGPLTETHPTCSRCGGKHALAQDCPFGSEAIHVSRPHDRSDVDHVAP